MVRRYSWAGLLILVLLSGSGILLLAQESAPPNFHVVVDLVQLNVAVTDNKGNYVTGLKPSDFVINEDGIFYLAQTQFMLGNEIEARRAYRSLLSSRFTQLVWEQYAYVACWHLAHFAPPDCRPNQTNSDIEVESKRASECVARWADESVLAVVDGAKLDPGRHDILTSLLQCLSMDPSFLWRRPENLTTYLTLKDRVLALAADCVEWHHPEDPVRVRLDFSLHRKPRDPAHVLFPAFEVSDFWLHLANFAIDCWPRLAYAAAHSQLLTLINDAPSPQKPLRRRMFAQICRNTLQRAYPAHSQPIPHLADPNQT